jgi:hypothetical protein
VQFPSRGDWLLPTAAQAGVRGSEVNLAQIDQFAIRRPYTHALDGGRAIASVAAQAPDRAATRRPRPRDKPQRPVAREQGWRQPTVGARTQRRRCQMLERSSETRPHADRLGFFPCMTRVGGAWHTAGTDISASATQRCKAGCVRRTRRWSSTLHCCVVGQARPGAIARTTKNAYARSGHTIAAGSPVRLKGDAPASPGCVCKARLSCAGNLVRIRVSSVTDRKFFR